MAVTVYAFEAWDGTITEGYVRAERKATLERITRFPRFRIIPDSAELVDARKVDEEGWYWPEL